MPTKAEWEYTAKVGSDAIENAKTPALNANTWQGVFPLINEAQDGYVGAAEVACFQPNESGLYDMLGNVWEWTALQHRATAIPC